MQPKFLKENTQPLVSVRFHMQQQTHPLVSVRSHAAADLESLLVGVCRSSTPLLISRVQLSDDTYLGTEGVGMI
jgi:hypothetical protein